MRGKLFRYVLVMLAVTGALMIAMRIYYQKSMTLFGESPDQTGSYRRHYLFVCGNNSEMWQKIYDSASKACNEKDAVLEWAGQNAPISYSLTQCMEIGIASHVDGLIVCPDGTKEMVEAIGDASGAGIPVVTLLKDASGSDRISYVGVSSYQLGELYGKQAAGLLTEDSRRVCLLTDLDDEEVAANLIYAQIVAALNESPYGKNVTVSVQEIDAASDFEAEESIRNILVEDSRPDILICTSPVQTECVLNAMIDYNLVSQVQIIGYYASDETLSAIRRQLIPVTMTIDPASAGETAVKALDEYISYGNVSDYFNLSLETVTSENLLLYTSRRAEKKRTEEERA